MVTRLMAEMTKQGRLLRQGKRFILCEPADEAPRPRETGLREVLPPSSGALFGGAKNDPRTASLQTARKPITSQSAPALAVGRASNAKRIAY